MDTEDREHFKTIASQSAELPKGSKPNVETAASRFRHDPVWTLQRAKMISGCYRRDEAHDPETFVSALALIFDEYPPEIVEYAADPRTGVINKFPMGLPQVPQIREYLEALMNERAARERYASLPRYKENRDALPLPERANIFVADIIPGYDQMYERHIATEGKYSWPESRICRFDELRHQGLWVPHHWWAQRHAVMP